jgi:hypothetical protein
MSRISRCSDHFEVHASGTCWRVTAEQYGLCVLPSTCAYPGGHCFGLDRLQHRHLPCSWSVRLTAYDPERREQSARCRHGRAGRLSGCCQRSRPCGWRCAFRAGCAAGEDIRHGNPRLPILISGSSNSPTPVPLPRVSRAHPVVRTDGLAETLPARDDRSNCSSTSHTTDFQYHRRTPDVFRLTDGNSCLADSRSNARVACWSSHARQTGSQPLTKIVACKTAEQRRCID